MNSLNSYFQYIYIQGPKKNYFQKGLCHGKLYLECVAFVNDTSLDKNKTTNGDNVSLAHARLRNLSICFFNWHNDI